MAQIDVNQDGPYQVSGGVPLRRKRAETTELGEPVGWQDDELLATDDTYWLCRCGGSGNKPF